MILKDLNLRKDFKTDLNLIKLINLDNLKFSLFCFVNSLEKTVVKSIKKKILLFYILTPKLNVFLLETFLKNIATKCLTKQKKKF